MTKFVINFLDTSSPKAKLPFYVIVWYIFSAILIGFFKFPKILLYLGDIFNIYVFLISLKKNRFNIKVTSVSISILIFIFIGIISAIVNSVPVLLILWAIRQNFRFFIFYYSCCVLLKPTDYTNLFKIVKICFWISFPLCFYEALIVKYPYGYIVGDYVGGIFYGIPGVNSALNIILSIYCTHILIKYFDNKLKFRQMLIVISAALVMSSLAEIKIFIYEIIFIYCIISFLKGFSYKNFVICLIGIVCFPIVVDLFIYFNNAGKSFYTKDYLSITGMIQNAFRSEGYNGIGDFNRMNAVSRITEMFFKNDMLGLLIGKGLGSAEYAQGSKFLTSEIYSKYGNLGYQFFSVAFVYIETGILGLISYFAIIISSVISIIKKNIAKDSKIFISCMGLIMIVMVVYNPSMRNEQSAFMLYMILSMSYVLRFK